MRQVLSLAAPAMLIGLASPGFADSWKHESGNGWAGNFNERGSYYESEPGKHEWEAGGCKYEYKSNGGGFKEEYKCDGQTPFPSWLPSPSFGSHQAVPGVMPSTPLMLGPEVSSRGGGYCREFRQDVWIAGSLQRAYGTACFESDGDWDLADYNTALGAVQPQAGFSENHVDEDIQLAPQPQSFALTLGALQPQAEPTANAVGQDTNSVSPAQPTDRFVTAQAGDTVYGLSRRYGIAVRDLIEANDLAPPYHLQIGQTVRLPGRPSHVVRGGNTITDIARDHGIATSDLVRVNDLDPPYQLYVGQRLVLPESGSSTATDAATFEEIVVAALIGDEPAPAAEAPTEVSASAAPVDDEAAPGAEGSIEVSELAAPVVDEPAPAADEPIEMSELTASVVYEPAPVADEPTEVSELPTPAVDEPAPADTATPEETEVATLAPVPDIPEGSGGEFAWPVHGTLSSSFGPKEDGQRNDGINIAAPAGTPVLAAEDGVVAYAGDELASYGNLILLRHADDWVTAYAHNGDIRVTKGQQVARGEVIASVGATGNVSSPQLHFEIREGLKAVDPLLHLEPLPDAGYAALTE